MQEILGRNIWRQLFIKMFLVVFTFQNAYAQFDPNKYRFERLTVEDGLPHSDALASVQDHEGFIWIATNKGVCRYDGYQLKPYHLPKNDHIFLPNDRIKALHVSQNGFLWVGTESNGVYFYDKNSDIFKPIDFTAVYKTEQSLVSILNKSDILCIESDGNGNLWFGTFREGLFQLKQSSDGVITSISQPLIDGEKSNHFQMVNLGLDNKNVLWIGTNKGLYLGKANTTNFLKSNIFVNSPIQQFIIDKYKNFWVATNNQLFWIPSKNLYKKIFTFQHQYFEIYSIYFDSYNNLWLGSEKDGLIMIPAKLSKRDSLLPVIEEKAIRFGQTETNNANYNLRRIRHIYEDKFSILWISTQAGGVSKLDLRQKQFGQLCPDKSGNSFKPTYYIKAIYKDEIAQKLWLGTWGGVVSYDFKTQKYTKFRIADGVNKEFTYDVSSIVKDSRNTIWVSTYSQGLFKLGNDQKFHHMVLKPSQNNVSAICEDNFGQIWLGVPALGLCLFNPNDGSLKFGKELGNSIPKVMIHNLLFDSKNQTLWLASKEGLFKFKVGKSTLTFQKKFNHEEGNSNSLKINYIWALCKDKKGDLWIGSIGGGLHRLYVNKEGKDLIQRYDSILPEQDVESILEDDNGQLWIGGTGLYKFNPQTNKYIRYDVNDGLQSNSFKIGAAWKSDDGTLYFGGINGVSYFQPNTIKMNTVTPIPCIIGLRVGNKDIGPGDTLDNRILLKNSIDNQTKIALRHDENDFAIEFVGLNYTNPHKNIYAYRLLGNNENWIIINQQRNVNFANLASGTYTFEVKVANGDGVWSVDFAHIEIVILPPWWQTWWAYLIYTLIIATGLWVYFQITETQRKLKNQLLIESLKYEKEKELSEMKLSFFTNVSHELRTPLTLILGPIEELVTSIKVSDRLSEKAHLIQKQTRKLLDLVNQLLEFRKVESGVLSVTYREIKAIEFLKEIFLIFKLKAEELNINYQFEAQEEYITLYADIDKLEIIIINLLSNAFKFTPTKGSIDMLVSVEKKMLVSNKQSNDDYLVIKIKDSGVGINPQELAKIFDSYYQAGHTESLKITGTGIGLSLVKQLVEAHLGEVSVKSKVGFGTEFSIYLPLGKKQSVKEKKAGDDNFIQNVQLSEIAVEELRQFDLLKETFHQDLHILIVEDNSEIRLYLQQLFEKIYHVSTASDGQEGINKAIQNVPDLIISDIMMPEVNGLELCKKLRQNPKTIHIPILLLTARTASIHEIEGLEMGADDYIYKPFNPHVLLAKVTMLLLNRQKLREYYSKQLLLEPTQLIVPDEEKLFLEKAMKIVENNIETPAFNVQALLKEMGMSQPVFYRKIKGITGKSGVEFIRDIRLKRAAQLLSTSSYRVYEVASMVGIEDLKYFRQHFQELFAVSPSEYSKKSQHKEA